MNWLSFVVGYCVGVITLMLTIFISMFIGKSLDQKDQSIFEKKQAD